MKAIIFDGSKEGDDTLSVALEITENELKEYGYGITSLILRKIEIAPCLGCFGCWVQTPGVCVIDDPIRDISKTAFQSDLLVFITPIIFGGYSTEIKKVLDRWISLVLPFFTKIQGEVHHLQRYKKHPNLFFIGSLPHKDDESRAIFEELVKRTAINSRAPIFTSELIIGHESRAQIRQKIDTCLNKMKENLD